MGKAAAKGRKRREVLKGISQNALTYYVEKIARNGDIYYTKSFYMDMKEKLEAGQTAVEAYNSLGFDTKILTEARANSAGTRAAKMESEPIFFKKDIAAYDSSVTFEQMLKRFEAKEIDADDLYANMASRMIVLETLYADGSAKKKQETVRSGQDEFTIIEEESPNTTTEKLEKVEEFSKSETAKILKLSEKKDLTIFKVHETTWFNWKRSALKEGGRLYELAKEDEEIQNHFLEVIGQLGFVPGARTFRAYLFRDYGMQVSINRCSRLMKEMNLVATNGRRPKKQGKKKEGAHCHPCAAVENKVNQDFYQGPRKIVLTDITYLTCNNSHKTFYFCVFYDCYTKEALGWSVGVHIDRFLVKKAYERMMEAHGTELRGCKVVIHSDQGSQYTSTTFKKLLEDDGFIQSMSERGNSQDNSPNESFFGRFKARMLDLVDSCPNVEKAEELIDGYMVSYNTKIYQHDLAGLTPEEFYRYKMTGIYPAEDYFGVKANDLYSGKEVLEERLKRTGKRNEQQRKKYAKDREERQKLLKDSPATVVEKDENLIKRKLRFLEKKIDKVEDLIEFFEAILEKIATAKQFLREASGEILDDLRNPLHWKNYPALSYVKDMNGMF